jgi:hypothetical protein
VSAKVAQVQPSAVLDVLNDRLWRMPRSRDALFQIAPVEGASAPSVPGKPRQRLPRLSLTLPTPQRVGSANATHGSRGSTMSLEDAIGSALLSPADQRVRSMCLTAWLECETRCLPIMTTLYS